MDRRRFLWHGGLSSLGAYAAIAGAGQTGSRLILADDLEPDNPDWTTPQYGPQVAASSHAGDPPWGYVPGNVLGSNVFVGWQASGETEGAWLEIRFPVPHHVREIWILPTPLPRDILGQAPYILTYSREQFLEPPRQVRISFSSGHAEVAALRREGFFDIILLPQTEITSIVRFAVEDVWAKPGGRETGLGKVKLFPRAHALAYDVTVYPTYDAQRGRPVQAATVHIINPGVAIRDAELRAAINGAAASSRLEPIPARSVTRQDIWAPAPFEDGEMEFNLAAASVSFTGRRRLAVCAYRSYFDGGTFSLNCTCHNDLGWLDTQAKTADYRSKEIIVPALRLMKQYPEFVYPMECTAYLMEFLERHPELRGEMAALMRDRRFTWGASYVECQEVHVGPEKLVRQFYFGRRWLKKTFPGVDTRFYVKTDPPSMTLQMPQILAKAGVKYCIQGRLPFGFHNWRAPDGTVLLTYAYCYVDPMRLLDPKDNHGWLRYAHAREYYYRPRELPRMFIYDYTSDYLPPQPALPPYVRTENEASKRFEEAWNRDASAASGRKAHPPALRFTTPEAFLDELTTHPLDITTLRGDWPFSWAYYDEPGHREGLLAGREAHNALLAAERLYAGLAASSGFVDYPQQEFEAAWKANTWPDHGWGGNHGVITDAVYCESYAKSKHLADDIFAAAGQKFASSISVKSGAGIPVVVFNPVNWERDDHVECAFSLPEGWKGFDLRDERGRLVPCEIVGREVRRVRFAFIARGAPSLGYRSYYLEPSQSSSPVMTPLKAPTLENDFLRVTFGQGGVKSLYDKRLKWEALRTEKFDGGEVLQFTAPGNAWEDLERVTMQDFDRTSNHRFPFKALHETPIRSTAVREAAFKAFRLREAFHLYHGLDRLEIEISLIDWAGDIARELRAAFPINLDAGRLSYEVPFGTVEMGKDEIDFSLLPPDNDTQFNSAIYGGDAPLAFREAINWIDASSPDYLQRGCLAASDITVHLFRDETANPVSYPLLQHVLLSTRKSLAWNPDYWFTQAGSHHYRMALMPHASGWRESYRDAIGFNYPLAAFAGEGKQPAPPKRVSPSASFLSLEPPNLVLTAMKKAEDDDRIVLRFYEAEGFESTARIRLAEPVRRAWNANLIEEDEASLPVRPDGSLELAVRPWEIVVVKVEV